MRKAVFAFVAAVAVASISPAGAGPFEDGVAAYERGDYATALRLLQPLAIQGGAAAQFNLAIMYEKGQGVTRDYAQARAWYRRAAAQGMAVAQFNLANTYRNGQGGPQDYAEALKWYRQAANQGNADAQYNLGVMHYQGQGVPPDSVKAHTWLSLAAARSSAAQTESHRTIVKVRDEVAGKMTPAQIAEAQKQAREWKPTSPRP